MNGQDLAFFLERVECGDIQTASRLLKKLGENAVNQTTSSTGRVALHLAVTATNQSVQMINWLLSQPALDANQRDASGETPLHCAISKMLQFPSTYRKETIEALLNSPKVDLYCVDNEGNWMLAQVLQSEHQELFDLFLAHPLLQDPAVRLFAHVVFVSDGLLDISEALKNSTDPDVRKKIRFIEILKKLPLELQMQFCNFVFGKDEPVILAEQSERGFKALTWQLEFERRKKETSSQAGSSHVASVSTAPVGEARPEYTQ